MLRLHALKRLARLVLAVWPHAAARVAPAQVDPQGTRLAAAGCGAHQYPLAVQPVAGQVSFRTTAGGLTRTDRMHCSCIIVTSP